MTDRAAFLRRVSEALGRSRSRAPERVPDADDRLLRRTAPSADLVAPFVERANAAGMATEVVNAVDLEAHVAAYCAEHACARVMVSVADGALRAAVERAIGARRQSPDAPFDDAFDAHLGVTDVIAAIAETGSLVLGPGQDRGRAPFLVPSRHLALVPRTAIVPDLLDWLRGADRFGTEGAAATIVVTGPSKTADIEGILVTGVHGPGVVDVRVIP